MASAPPTAPRPCPMKPGAPPPTPSTDPATAEAGEDLLYAARTGEGRELEAALGAGAPPHFADAAGRTGANSCFVMF